jgi:hypothetical protein
LFFFFPEILKPSFVLIFDQGKRKEEKHVTGEERIGVL